MGMMIYDALVMARIASGLPGQKKKVLALGVPTLNFSSIQFQQALKGHPDILRANAPLLRDFRDHKEFFSRLGFEGINVLDISAYEGADIIGDLNDPDCAGRIADQYDLVYDHGTVEHVFDASTALRTINRLVKPGGVVVHSAPANGFMDHGFWQISPNLLRTFYQSAGFETLTSALLVLGPRPYAIPAAENYYRTRGRAFVAEQIPEALIVFAARKVKDVPNVQVGLQDYYAHMHEGASADGAMQFFIPFGSRTLGRLWKFRPLAVAMTLPSAVLGFLARIKRLLLGASRNSKQRHG
jgi:SAM-dependent methyltransferase